MKNRQSFIMLALTSLILPTYLPVPIWARQSVDHSGYAALLKAHVKNGQVDYADFKKDEKKLGRYLALLEKVAPENLGRDEQLAFYINLYNAWTLKLILDNYPGVESIKDLGTLFKSPWKKSLLKSMERR